jgi:HlyD family type I secretion membrane fusion protein
MKITGSSKIISKTEEKAAQENLISIAEAADLVHSDELIEHNAKPKTKVQQIKKTATDLLNKTKPFREKQKLLAGEAVKKARGLSPYVDKTITIIDESVNYLTKPAHIEGRSQLIQDTRSPSVFGIWVMIATFGGFMMWAIFAPLDSASSAMGKIILDSKKRIIQHPDGGVIKEILVREGDHVTKGQTLMLLDDTQLRAKKKQHEYRYLVSVAEVARLLAERDGLEEIKFPEKLLIHKDDPEVQKMIKNQINLFNSRKTSLSSRLGYLEQSIAQAVEEKKSILHQIEANDKLLNIVSEQVESYKKLYAKGNIQKNFLQDAESRKAEYQGKKGSLSSTLAGTEQKIIQQQVYRDSQKDDYFEKVSTELKVAHAQLSVENESLKEISEYLDRTVITAPEEGNISNLNDNLTPRGTLHPQNIIMEIVPQDDKLIVEAKIKAMDISVVRVGQKARVRLTAFRSRIVPILEGEVISLSADAVAPTTQMEMQESQGGVYYKARIEIDKDQLKDAAELKDVILYPGMQVEVMVIIGTRTMMKYLLDPITTTLSKSFTER